jgi:carbon-monoxide dehydrogenase large subunit
MMTTLYNKTPSPLNPLGMKGVGEAGTIPAAAVLLSPIEHALRRSVSGSITTPVTDEGF